MATTELKHVPCRVAASNRGAWLAWTVALSFATGCVDKDVLANTPSTGSSSAAAQGGVTSAGAATSNTSGTTASTGSPGTTTGTSAATTGATTSTTSGNSTSGGGFRCPGGFGYVGGNCVSTSCTGFANDTLCELPDAGLGFCFQATCSALDLSSDPNNCGAVGLICASDTTCLSGICTGPGGSPSSCANGVCPAGTVCIGSDCYYDQACSGAPINATCFASATASESGECCNGSCLQQAQLETDPNNCGGCGNVCPAGSLCANNVCVPTTCTANSALGASCFLPDGGQENFGGETAAACCGGACRDLTQDPNNCGSCGLFCPGGQTCQNGTCTGQCKANADCGSGAACTDTGCFPTTCAAGESNTACAIIVSTSTVVAGACCNGTCANFYSDPQNCGACGVACGAGACVEGACTLAPSNCATEIPGSLCSLGANQGQCCDGACTLNDDANCGGCGLICPTGSSCTSVGGVPVCVSGGQVSGCTSSSQCAAGQTCLSNAVGDGLCVSNTCTAETAGAPCGLVDGGAGTCCGTVCSNLISDPLNCQGCGAVCPTGTICVGAEESDGPLANCVAPGSSNPAYCSPLSACPAGFICPPNDDACIQATCAGQIDGTGCVFGATSTGTVDGECCGGQCVSEEDVDNCGACGVQCSGGECINSPFGGVSCVQPGVSNCTQTCAPGSACLGAVCAPVTCSSVFSAVCPADDGNLGFCTSVDGGFTCEDLTNDPRNCGAPGAARPAGQTCAQGICSGTPAPCNVAGAIGGFCNFDAGFGWNCCQATGCVDFYTDSNNCGGCGVVCPQGQTCTQGTCG